MHHPGGLHMGSDEQTRQIVRDHICQLIGRRKPTTPMMIPNLPDLARRLEVLLYMDASSKEEYANLNTLEQRLQMCVVRIARSRKMSHSISSSSVGTMMPTPGMTNHGSSNSSVASSAANSMIPVSIRECNTGVIDTMNSRRLLSTSDGSTAGVSFCSSEGSIPNGLHKGSDEQPRQIVRDYICQLIGRRKPTTPMMIPNLPDLARRLDEVLYRDASSKEEYANLNTLEQRLQMWIARIARDRKISHSISSSSVGTMMPTPGMTNHMNSNSSVTSSAGNSMIPVSISECNTGVIDPMNSRRLLSTSNGSTAGVSFSSSDGSIPNGLHKGSDEQTRQTVRDYM